jgi:hypothetical protein
MSRARFRASAFSTAFALLVGCPAPAPGPIDADLMFPDGGHDAGPAPIWVEAAPFPVPIAYATANILASGGQRWIFVVGGADADRDSVTTMYSTIYRAELMADGSLGPWELNGDLSLLGMNLRLAQHGAIRLNGEMGEQGIAIAGGDSSAGPIPRVLAGYLDTMGTGTLTAWGAFEPSLASGEAHVLGTFDPLGAHALALIGGFGGDGMPTARVDIALIDVVPPAPTFLAGPPLPAPRVAHRTVQVGTTFFIVGGESATDPHPDVLRSERDMGGAGDVVGWAVAGTIEDPPSDHAAFEIDGEMWVVGGIEGGRDGGLLSTRARHAPIGAGDTVGTFVDAAAYELPVGLADSAVVVDDTFVYMIGGRSVGGLASSTTVLIGRF